jgi:hypothetical protein
MVQDAILRKELLVVRYKDRDRLMVPFVLGRTQDGRVVLHAYQMMVLADHQERGDGHESWWVLYLDEMEDVEPVPCRAYYEAVPFVKSADGQFKPAELIHDVVAMVKL